MLQYGSVSLTEQCCPFTLKTQMLKTTLITGSIILAGLYIGFGDRFTFLPTEMRTTSVETRTSLTKFGTGLIPNWVSKTKEKPDSFERTEQQLQQEQQAK